METDTVSIVVAVMTNAHGRKHSGRER